MAEDVKPKRRYDASRRREAAQQARLDVLDAARALFVRNGYAGTSVRQIADEAGVSVQTLYGAFTSKAGILRRLTEIAVVGDDEPVALADREVVESMRTAPDADEMLARSARFVREIWDRFGELLPVLRDAAAVEPEFAAAHHQNVVVARRAGLGEMAGHLVAVGGVRNGLETDEIADILWTLKSPEVYEALVLVQGWTSDHYQAWLQDTTTTTLLDPKRPKRRKR